MVDLRDAFIRVLREQSSRRQGIVLEVALLDGINDSDDDARHLFDFVQPFPGKVVINLIPWNDIRVSNGPAAQFRTSTRVTEFQQTIRDLVLQQQREKLDSSMDDGDKAVGRKQRKKRQIQCFVRTTRGDDELAACGQLSTKFQSSPRSSPSKNDSR